jgi:hypothetical protein
MNGSAAPDLEAPPAFGQSRPHALGRPPLPTLSPPDRAVQDLLLDLTSEAFSRGLTLGFLAGRLYVGHVRDGLGHDDALRMALAEAARDLSRSSAGTP